MENEFYSIKVTETKVFTEEFLKSWGEIPGDLLFNQKRCRIVTDRGRVSREYRKPYFFVKPGVPITFKFLLAIHAYYVQEEGYTGTAEELFAGVLFVEDVTTMGFPADDENDYLVWDNDPQHGCLVAHSMIRRDLPLGV